ncbi:hypothetical protein C2G38_2137569 [Gigaspora rosea]|uniref:Galactose oxidase n=1 Tax=Gigaspora rosea TaxID=44941 RepID=A0A397W181_9GLOM|nr:hypothetical protein C2G38_2137569 [Gigaspora rosea]
MKFFQKVLYYFFMINEVIFFVICRKIPNSRFEQASALVGTRLYFFGGLTSQVVTNEVWYLDLSNSFNTTTPPWRSDIGMPVGYILGSSCVNPINNCSILLIGGKMYIPHTLYKTYSSCVYMFNPCISQWTISNLIGFNRTFIARSEMQAIIDNNGRIFIFSGKYYNSSVLFDDMNILDITTMTWSTPPISQNVPIPRLGYTATLLQNDLIVYIGGYGTPQISMNEV